MIRLYWFLLGALAVWRITHLLQGEDGPWQVVARLRRLVGASFVGTLLDCFYCLSLWSAAPIACWLGEGWKERLLLWLALSAGAILLQNLAGAPNHAAPYFEEQENDHVMLREDERTVPGSGHKR